MFLGVVFCLRKHRESGRKFQVLADGELKFAGGVHPHPRSDIERQQVAQAENALVFFEVIARACEVNPGKNTGKPVQVVIVVQSA